MSRNELDLILRAINETCEAHKEGIRGILASVEANAIVFGNDLRDIKKHLKEMNGTVAELKKESNNRALVVQDYKIHKEKQENRLKWAKKNWWLILLAFIVSVVIIFEAWKRFSIKEIWEFIKSFK